MYVQDASPGYSKLMAMGTVSAFTTAETFSPQMHLHPKPQNRIFLVIHVVYIGPTHLGHLQNVWHSQ
jgi:hypothetical protein